MMAVSSVSLKTTKKTGTENTSTAIIGSAARGQSPVYRANGNLQHEARGGYRRVVKVLRRKNESIQHCSASSRRKETE